MCDHLASQGVYAWVVESARCVICMCILLYFRFGTLSVSLCVLSFAVKLIPKFKSSLVISNILLFRIFFCRMKNWDKFIQTTSFIREAVIWNYYPPSEDNIYYLSFACCLFLLWLLSVVTWYLQRHRVNPLKHLTLKTVHFSCCTIYCSQWGCVSSREYCCCGKIDGNSFVWNAADQLKCSLQSGVSPFFHNRGEVNFYYLMILMPQWAACTNWEHTPHKKSQRHVSTAVWGNTCKSSGWFNGD